MVENLKLEDFLVVKKKSRIEVDAMKIGLDWEKVLLGEIRNKVSQRYNNNRQFMVRNIDAHSSLYHTLTVMQELGFKGMIEREELDAKNLIGKKAVISVGGDNHLIWILDQLEFLGYDLPVIAMNATPEYSRGGILYHDRDNIAELLEKCMKGTYQIEKWPKIEGEIEFDSNKTSLFPATAEYVLGEHVGTQASRWVLMDEEQRGNRLIICNGVGSSGWHSNNMRALFSEKDVFDRERRELRHSIDGPMGNVSGYNQLHGSFGDGDVVEVVSYNDDRGVATTDSINEDRYIHEFPFGAVARLWVSKKVSRVIRG